MAQALNFSMEFYETDDATSEQWGMKTENGTYTGLLGEMVISLLFQTFYVEMFNFC